MMRNPRESDILRQCLDLLTIRRVFHWRQNAGVIPLPNNGRGRGNYRRFVGLKGVSDIIAIHGNGRFIGIEIKSLVGTLSTEQRAFRDAVVAAGGDYIVIRDVRELEAWLSGNIRSDDLRK